MEADVEASMRALFAPETNFVSNSRNAAPLTQGAPSHPLNVPGRSVSDQQVAKNKLIDVTFHHLVVS